MTTDHPHRRRAERRDARKLQTSEGIPYQQALERVRHDRRTLVGCAERRRPTLALLQARVPYSTVDISPAEARYVGVARSEYSDDLHLVAAGDEICDVLGGIDAADDFSPVAVVDLDAPVSRCVHPVRSDDTNAWAEDYALDLSTLGSEDRRPRIVDTRMHELALDGSEFTVEEEIWDLATPTYHVYDADGECLTADDAFEHFPTSDDLRSLIDPPQP